MPRVELKSFLSLPEGFLKVVCAEQHAGELSMVVWIVRRQANRFVNGSFGLIGPTSLLMDGRQDGVGLRVGRIGIDGRLGCSLRFR